MEPGLHVVFGAGQIGPFLARRLLADGQRVRIAKRSPAGVPEGAEFVPGDASDPAFCRQVAHGAQVLYHCMNPPYDAEQWERFLPVFMNNLIAAAGAHGARLVVLDNLYMIGTGGGRPINEDTPVAPRSRKGEIRARVAELLFAAHRRGDVQAVCGRASDFYGPGGVGTHFGEVFWPAALAGKPAPFLPRPRTLHTFHYIPDVAAGLAMLGSAPPDVLGRWWALPCAPPGTSLDMVERFARALGRPIRLRTVPRWAVGAMGIVMPMMRELGEMLHQWDVPFVVDDSRFRVRFGAAATPTDPDAGAAATVDWARRTFGGAVAP